MPPEDPVLEGGEEKSLEEENVMKKRGVSGMVKIFHFVMKQSYICALIAMMVSNSYRDWLRLHLCQIQLNLFNLSP